MILPDMTDTLETVCQKFPLKFEQPFDASSLHKGLPSALKARLKQKRGFIQMASDSSIQVAPSRNGIGLRSYQQGDPLRSLHMRKLLLQDSLESRVEMSPGRERCCILLHAYGNMNFTGSQNFSKFQLAQVLTALIQLHLKGHFKEVDTFCISSEHFALESIQKAGNILNKCHSIFVITDGFFGQQNISESGIQLQKFLQQFKAQKNIWYVRNEFESATFWKTHENELTLEKHKFNMVPFYVPKNTAKNVSMADKISELESNKIYVQNLTLQEIECKKLFHSIQASFNCISTQHKASQLFSLVEQQLTQNSLLNTVDLKTADFNSSEQERK